MASPPPRDANEVKAYAAQVAQEEGLPPSWFLAMLQAESGFSPDVGSGKRKSSAGAIGYGQLMPGTAASLGVDPTDWRQNIQGSARYLKQQFDRFHNPRLALSAYNSGPGGSESRGQVENIVETKLYVAKVAALEKQYRNFGGAEPFAGKQLPEAEAQGESLPPADTQAPPNTSLAADPGYLSSLRRIGPLSSRIADQAQLFQPLSAPSPTQPEQEATSENTPTAKFKPQSDGGSPIAYDRVIGLPYQGTHTDFGNWESDNAVDLSAPVGTPIYAREAGTIGDQIGPLSSSNPQLAGERLHLKAKDNEFYYAHLSKIVVKAGQHVKKGQLLGYSGSANGVAHLHFAVSNGDPRSYIGRKGPKS